MRKLLIFPIVLLVMTMASVVSCGPSAEEKRLAELADSTRRADSLAQVEAARLAAIREDSIRRAQDSIAKIEEFKAKIPSIKNIINEDLSFLTGLGFTETEQDNGETGEMSLYCSTYRLELDADHYCEIIMTCGYEWHTASYRIVGFPDLMQQEKSIAKKNKARIEEELSGVNYWIEIKPSIIKWGSGV